MGCVSSTPATLEDDVPVRKEKVQDSPAKKTVNQPQGTSEKLNHSGSSNKVAGVSTEQSPAAKKAPSPARGSPQPSRSAGAASTGSGSAKRQLQFDAPALLNGDVQSTAESINNLDCHRGASRDREREKEGDRGRLRERGKEQEPAREPTPPLAVEATIPRPPNNRIAATTFTFDELKDATNGFSNRNFLGEGGFGRVYKGRLPTTGQVVAVKQLDRNGLQGNREFLVEVLMLSLLHHPNLVNLIGYCADGDQRLLVYDFMAKGALEDHLHDLPPGKAGLDWNIRMKVAAGAAKGLEYLHEKANPPVIYRDFKSSNILLDDTWAPKLSDFGLAKLGPVGDKTHVSTRVMGTYGYCAPEYAMTGQLTVKSDVYSFGVVLLELVTGRKAIDNTRAQGEQNLVAWARPLFKDRRRFPSMADPLLQGKYPMRGLYQALAVAAMCLQEQATLRPMTHDVVTALNYLASQPYEPTPVPASDRQRTQRSNSPSTTSRSSSSPQRSPQLSQVV